MMNTPKDPPYQLFALHGFLGHSTDWKMFHEIHHPIEIMNENLDLWAWSHAFNKTITRSSSKNILLGYSLGGRLAMHALLSKPSLWDAAIFISAHPGLTASSERIVRQKHDQEWAQRFLTDSWSLLMHEWNTNAVFGGRPFPFSRTEKEFNREKLSQQLVNWSLGNQDPLFDRLKNLPIPMLFLAGELDSKFCGVAEQFKEIANVSIIPDAVHRLPWEQPEKFMQEVKKFCSANCTPSKL
jgi:2-succinyl-6-hydroxy-2,4-cyclohexadiene-1-carboxylate synthase